MVAQGCARSQNVFRVALRHSRLPRATYTPKTAGVPGLAVAIGQQEGYRGTVTPRLTLLGSILLLLFAAGCTNQYVTRGAELYAGGLYIEAAEVFERTERRLDRASPSERAQYGLYRGATLLALGDSRRARRWLRYSERLLQSNPALLSAEERDMLRRALGVLATQSPTELVPRPRSATTAMIH